MQDYVFMNGEMLEIILKENDKLKKENQSLKETNEGWQREYEKLYKKYVETDERMHGAYNKIHDMNEWEDKALELIGKLFEENAALHQKVRDMDEELSTALAEVDEWKFYAEHPDFYLYDKDSDAWKVTDYDDMDEFQ